MARILIRKPRGRRQGDEYEEDVRADPGGDQVLGRPVAVREGPAGEPAGEDQLRTAAGLRLPPKRPADPKGPGGLSDRFLSGNRPRLREVAGSVPEAGRRARSALVPPALPGP